MHNLFKMADTKKIDIFYRKQSHAGYEGVAPGYFHKLRAIEQHQLPVLPIVLVCGGYSAL